MSRMNRCATWGVAVACGVLLTTINPAAHRSATVIMEGLSNPRGLALGPDGALYVAEAGRGGDGPCVVNASNETRCFGLSGAISRYRNGRQRRIVTGLPSHALPTGEQAGGPTDIGFQPRGGGAYVTIGLGFDPAVRESFGPGGQWFGKLLYFPTWKRGRAVADVSAYEATANPAGGPIDTNPFGLLTLPASRFVVDAGANALLNVSANGDVSTVAVFPSKPDRTVDAVPTAVAVGPDGAYYVSELTGAPFAAGSARIYRVVPGAEPRVYLDGFKTIVDIDFGRDGSLYVLEHATGPMFFAGPGDLIRIAPDGSRTRVMDDLTRPTSLIVDADDTIYVSNRGISADAGEVLQVIQ
jgi:hypothetical protein